MSATSVKGLFGSGRSTPSPRPARAQDQWGDELDPRDVRAYPDPAYRRQRSDQIVAGVLALILGSLGVHKFYLGFNTAGIIMLVVWLFGWILILPPFVIMVISIVEGLKYLLCSDEDFYEIYVLGRREWF